jgi:hypothetical protein
MSTQLILGLGKILYYMKQLYIFMIINMTYSFYCAEIAAEHIFESLGALSQALKFTNFLNRRDIFLGF